MVTLRFSRLWWGIVAGAMVLSSMIVWIQSQLVGVGVPEPTTFATPGRVAAAPRLSAPTVPEPWAGVPSSVTDGARPPGVDAMQWARLQNELRNQPVELRRVTAYLTWSDALSRFRSASARNADRSTIAALAGALDQGLTDRLANREISAAEARSIKAAVLEATVGDVAERQASLTAWIDAHPAGAFGAMAADLRQAEFERRQAALLTTHRDPQALARELDALRARVFGPPR